MSKVDWSLAPEGATSFVGGNWPWRKVECDIEYYWSVCLYEWCELPIIQRKQPKPWSGPEDGLPPVNTSCQMQDDMGQWVDVLIIANHDGYAHGWQSAEQDCFYSNDPAEFRAVSTPEQLRETAIRELMDIAQVDCRVTAARLVDAGFKREVV